MFACDAWFAGGGAVNHGSSPTMIIEMTPLRETQLDPEEEKEAEEPPFMLFPLEIWTEILHLLEVCDILRVRRVCSYLRSASRQRSLWISILQNPPPPMDLYSFFVDKKLEMCTSSDLEGIVINCLRRHKVWGDPSLLRRRKLGGVPGGGPFFIVPGGRWAIAFEDTENAIAFDLHQTGRPSFILCPRTPGGVPRYIEATLQTQEAGLQDELKLAIYSRDKSDKACIEVWLVQPSYDADGQVDGLQSKKLSSFACGLQEFSWIFSISGSFVAFSYSNWDNDSISVGAVAIDWAEANGQDDFAKILKHILRSGNLRGCQILCLLPDATLLTNSGGGYELWDLRSLQPVFRFEDSAEARPILRGDTPLDRHDSESLHVVSRDGKVRAAHTRTDTVHGAIVSNSGIEDAPSAPICFSQGEDKLAVSIRLQAIDKFLEIRDPVQCRDRFIMFKSAWFGSTDSCPATSFHFKVLQFGGFHIDPYSGLIAIRHWISHDQTLVDFPFINS